jgi:two-component sensor histidine kinase
MSGASAGREVLLVEDDEGVAELVKERLEGIGCSCEVAGTGREALAAIATHRPDLVVLDYSLPDMRADELIAIKDMPPFMIATGRGDEATAVRLMRAGARDYVIKDYAFLDELPLVALRVLDGIDTEERLAAARADLESRLREKDAMLREIHHRVKNNLQIISSLVRLQTPPGADERLSGFLSDIQGRISAMSLIHETLYESDNLARVDFLAYLDALARNLELALAPKKGRMKIACSGEGIELPIDTAVPLGLIANELLTNAIKHAFCAPWKGDARVSVATGMSPEGLPFLAIEDNGRGFASPAREGTAEGTGLGLTLVGILVQQIGATVSRGSPASGSGTVWRIELPMNSYS